jgi:hypothetical protein
MSTNSPVLDRLGPAGRPREKAIGHHRWSNLLFVHWRLPAEAVKPLLPLGLSLDTWEGDAWIGLVPFGMSRVRPWWSPPLPGVSSFCETNVRTYVHCRGRNPGVWFFSLDAAQSLAVRIARRRWHLPYYRSEMNLRRDGARVTYSSRRLWPGTPGAGCAIAATIGDAWSNPSETPIPQAIGHAPAGTLEHWLIERYILYAERAGGRLLAGRVHHAPYRLRTVRLERLECTLLAAAGLAPAGEPCHAIFSDGLDVDVFPLRAVE